MLQLESNINNDTINFINLNQQKKKKEEED